MEIRLAKESELSAVFALRYEVFVLEQKVSPEIELDLEDTYAQHFLVKSNEMVIGCARAILSDRDAHIGRLAVKKEYRGQGVGSQICRYIIEHCKEQGCSNIWLNSQLHAVEFYEKLGFKKQGEIFLEAEIEHIKMII